ncbi:glycosyltransferase family 4 protein [Falsiroseomonas sp.]|uniref:glycosyltransferase family 4 protein n=1 Tax=Falsiroseomonas sp. TaxID=2870721 RepID=UPI002732F57F|nr:glycosyltransferase family 4 protein [Falsiroseomonas sp.]MDP3418335.1 glycosyltransferase family 4 protein [Falsiroseomonas sp.]
MRVLAAVIVPPHLSVSGGARAAEQLSAALAPYCDITVASMMNGTGTQTHGAGPMLRRRQVRSALPPLLPWSWLPNRYATLFYRSDIPRLVAEGHDIVHLHNPMPALEFGRIARACRARGTPYVISTHGFNEVANGGTIYGFDAVRRQVWQQLVYAPVARAVRGAAAVFALSPADIEIVRGMGFAGSIVVVNNGVDLPPLSAPQEIPGDAAPQDAEILAKFGIPPDAHGIRCMFLANHTANKGLPDLLAAFGKLEIPFTLVVGGERRDTVDYGGHLHPGRQDQRIIVTGRLSDTEVAALFRQSDLFVFPTLADTFPLVVLEAMSHGVPVLASRVGGIPYQIDEGSGVLVPPGDPGALAAAVERLAAEPDRLRQMGRHARARVAAEFTWQRAADRAMEGYRAVLCRHRGGVKVSSRVD